MGVLDTGSEAEKSPTVDPSPPKPEVKAPVLVEPESSKASPAAPTAAEAAPKKAFQPSYTPSGLPVGLHLREVSRYLV